MRVRLAIALGSLLLLVGLGSLAVRHFLSETGAEFDTVLELQRIEQLRRDLVDKVLEVQSDLLASRSVLDPHFGEAIANVQDLENTAATCAGCHHEPRVHEQLVTMRRLLDVYQERYADYLTARGSQERLERLRSEAAVAGERLVVHTTKMSTAASHGLRQRLLGSRQAADRASRTLGVTLALAGLLAVGTLVWLSRSLTIPVRALVGAARRIEAGRLGEEVALRDGGELGELARAFNRMSRSLADSEEQQRRVEERLRYGALHDSLTGLPNRALFLERLRDAAARAAATTDPPCFAVLYVDLNRFKIVNDTLGHDVGDRVMITIGRRLGELLRPTDTVARIGGDEFVILLNRLDAEGDAVEVARRVERIVATPCVIGERTVRVTASIGVSVNSIGFEEPEDLLRYADVAMYRAKEAGPGQILVFDRELHQRTMELMELERELRHGLDGSELECHYQPIVRLPEGTLAGFEALLRWRHPTQGLLYPEEFLPLAEDTGLILGLGAWVTETVFRQAHAWHERFGEELDLFLVANVSGRQLVDESFVPEVRRLLEETGVEARRIKFELTETTLLEGAPHATRKLEQLCELGFELCLDDFGTGYSALGYLLRLPISNIKIDRSFLVQRPDSETSATILQAIVDLAHRLDKTVTAEGIEAEEQYERVLALGCELGQGFLISRPLMASEAERVLAETVANGGRLVRASLPGGEVLRFRRPR